MTLVSAIQRRAYRAANVVTIGANPTTAETAESLDMLNGVVQSLVDQVAELSDLDIGGEFNQSSVASSGIPDNARLVCQQGGTFDLDPLPYDGQRVAAVDSGANFATSNLILSGNGRKIETAASATLNINGTARQWFYRGDTANWVRISDLVAGDTFPFPTEFDQLFILELALLLMPANSASLPQESMMSLTDLRGRWAARYRKPKPPQDTGTYGLLGQQYGGGSEASLYGRG